MNKGRLEAFSDGVIAIIITIMVLEMKTPQGDDLTALRAVVPTFLSYVLSFIYVGIYWNNHHHLYQAVKRITGMTLWANLHLLFWLSLIPFVTRWMSATQFATWPVVAYGIVLLMCAVAWDLQRRALVHLHGQGSAFVRAMSGNLKEWISLFLYAVAVGSAFISTWIACALYALVALIWLVPDRRVEREVEAST
jgi:uncharacterized membrane protein